MAIKIVRRYNDRGRPTSRFFGGYGLFPKDAPVPFLVVKSKEGTRTYPLLEGKPMYLGRADECDIVLPSPSVSRRHAVILFKNGICGVKDLGSFNGTLLNDHAVQSPQHLTDHDILKISSFIIRLQTKRKGEAPDASMIPLPSANRYAHGVTVAIEKPDRAPPGDARTYLDSDLLLPRAMLEAIKHERPAAARPDGEDTHDFVPGVETAAFLENLGRPQGNAGEGDPNSTEFFISPPYPVPAEAPAPAADSPESTPISLKEDAASAIPLIDPEEVPVLTFAADPEAAEPEPDDPDKTADEPPAVVLAQLAEEIAPVPLVDDGAGLDPVPVSAEMAARIEERLSLYADDDALAEDKEALPRVFKACYSLARDEPLAKEFYAADISHGRLFGGGLYLLILRDMLGKNTEGALRLERLRREAVAMEKLVADEFRRAYLGACLRFLPEHESMPVVVRAFLRHGMLGVNSWWLRREVRDFIIRDCQDHAPLSVQFDTAGAMVLYAEKYLAAVAEMECAPSPNPNLENLEWLTVERLADRSYRRIVNAGSYNIRLKGLINDMEDRLRDLDAELMVMDERMEATANESDARSRRADLVRDRQVLMHQLERIKDEIMNSILEAVQQAEGRFRRGELRMPKQTELIRSEALALLDLGTELSGGDRVFMPLVLRERFPLLPDVINDRQSLRAAIAELEERQPGMFIRVLNPLDRRDEQLQLRLPPVFVLYPTSGIRCFCSLESRGMDGGHIFVPVCYSSRGVGDGNLAAVLLEYRERSDATSTA